MIDVAWAQGGGGAPPAFVQFGPILAIFAIFYFLLIRPQQKKAQEHQQMLDELKRNDEVVTGGGIYGKVTALTDDVATVEIAPKVQIRVSRGTISHVSSARGEKEKTKEKEK